MSPYRKPQPSNYTTNSVYERILSSKYHEYKPDLQSSSEKLETDSFLEDEDIPPTVPSNTREIYPHRKTNSYINKYGNHYEQTDYVSPFAFFSQEGDLIRKLDLDMDLDGSYSQNFPSEEILSNHSKYEQQQKNKNYEDVTERTSTPVNMKQDNASLNKGTCTPSKDSPSPNHTTGRSSLEFKNKQNHTSYDEYCHEFDITPEDRKFIDALNNAVKDKDQNFVHALDSAVQYTKRCYDDMDIENQTESPMKQRLSSSMGPRRSSSLAMTQSERVGRAELKGILKNAKSWQNMSIKRLHSAPPVPSTKEETVGSEIPFSKMRDNDTDYSKPVRYQAERPLEDSSDSRKLLTMRERKLHTRLVLFLITKKSSKPINFLIKTTIWVAF